MKARLVRTKTSGQSIPLIALMIVVLFAMVGLAVDVGNTYAEQRNTVRASNAASLAGMNALINGSTDADVYNVIVESLKSNNIQVAAPGVQPGPGERVLAANYLDSSGNPLASCPNVGGCGSNVPQGVTYIRVNVGGKVDTFFARLVGQQTLPVGANAYASKGACVSGIYPITLRDDLLDENGNGFKNPDAIYNDSLYHHKTLKRVYMKDPSNPSGGFNWVRWRDTTPDPTGKNPGSKEALEGMLTGPGNIDGGFDEVMPWPQNSPLPMSAGYPPQRHLLNPGDWIYGNSGVSAGVEVKAQLDLHIENRTVMILPIHDADDGGGINGNYHVSRLGAFLLRGYNLTGQGYFDLVYLGNAGECATLVTPPAKNTNLGITGQVVFRPRNKATPQSRPPVQYNIILDVSGSMTWKFDGYGWRDGHAVLCTGANANCEGSDAWPDKTQRRIYIAKQALKAFIDNMQANDSMRIVAFHGKLDGGFSNQRAINELTETLPSDWSSDKATLKGAVDDAGAVGGDPYMTTGRTPSATGIAAGNQALASAATHAPDGQAYKRVVIFMTDGVANVFRDGKAPDYTAPCGSEVATCNVGYNDASPPAPMPITAMGLEADKLKQLATIYVIALAGVDETGLPNVASAQNYPYYSSAKNGTDLAGIFANIATDVKLGQCVPQGGNTWQNTMSDSELGDISPPLTYPIVGTVYLSNQNGQALPAGQGQAPIQVNPQTGKLTYHFDNLTPGTYQMQAFVAYKGSDDISRIYDQIYNPNTATMDATRTFPLSPSNTLGTVVPMDLLYLDGSWSVCPTS